MFSILQDLIITQLVFNKCDLSSRIRSLFEKSKKSSSSTTRSNNKNDDVPSRSVKLSKLYGRPRARIIS